MEERMRFKAREKTIIGPQRLTQVVPDLAGTEMTTSSGRHLILDWRFVLIQPAIAMKVLN